MQKKQHKDAISLIFKKGDNVLVLKRSPSKASFPSAWSLPSTYIYDDETLEETATRLVKRKLGDIKIIVNPTPIGTSPVIDRGEYTFLMADYEVEDYASDIVFNPEEYTEMRWVSAEELLKLIEDENNGKIGECTRTFLTSKGLL